MDAARDLECGPSRVARGRAACLPTDLTAPGTRRTAFTEPPVRSSRPLLNKEAATRCYPVATPIQCPMPNVTAPAAAPSTSIRAPE